MITNSLPVIGCGCEAGSVILKVMLEAAAEMERARLRRTQAIENWMRRRTRFMFSPES
jgi:hypothetical protein